MHAPYRRLALALSVNTILMFFIGYAMIERLDHFRFNVNTAYMALMMAAPMGSVMLLVMRSMFTRRWLNAGLHLGLAAVFVGALLLVRTQTPIGEDLFLRSMIPHHSGAILMCEQSSLTNPEVVALCDQIIASQREEIAQMQAILARQPRP